jgi:hypothetical protein
MLRGERHDENVFALAVSIQAPLAAEDAFAVLPQHVETITSLVGDWRGHVHLAGSGIGPATWLRGMRQAKEFFLADLRLPVTKPEQSTN